MSKTNKVPKKFITKLQGKKFITYEGLIELFHSNGGNSIKTDEINITENQAIFKAIVKGENGTYTGYGDADHKNVNPLIAKHFIRMAETRAIARALRLYNNIGMTAVEELGGDDSSDTSQASSKASVSPQGSNNGGKPWLNSKARGKVTKEWKNVVAKLSSGDIKMSDVYKNYKVSKNNRAKLEKIANSDIQPDKQIDEDEIDKYMETIH